MSKFKVGDKVICTEADLNAYVKESVVYTVAGIPYNDDDEWITLKEVQTRIGTVPQYDATYFKIAVQPKTGDKVRLTTTYVEGETKGEDIEVVEEAPTLYPGAVVQGSYNRLWVMQDDGWFRTTDDEPHYESPERAQQEVAKGNWTIKFEGVKP